MSWEVSFTKRKQILPKKFTIPQAEKFTEANHEQDIPLDLSMPKKNRKPEWDESNLLDLKSSFSHGKHSAFTSVNKSEVPLKLPLDLSVKSKQSPNWANSSHRNLLNCAQSEKSKLKLVRGQEAWLNSHQNAFVAQVLKCLECCQSFHTLNDLSSHMVKSKHFSRFNIDKKNIEKIIHTSPPQNANKISKANSPSSCLRNYSNQRTTGSLLCLICRERFFDGAALVEHLQNKHVITQICTSCGAYFETFDAYRTHLAKEEYHHKSYQKRRRQSLCDISAAPKTTVLIQSGIPDTQPKITENFVKNLDAPLKRKSSEICSKEIKKSRSTEVPNNEDIISNEEHTKPLKALEILVNTNISPMESKLNSVKSPLLQKSKEDPLNSLQKMHSNFNSYVY